MMKKSDDGIKDIHFPTFNEDSFDLEEHKRAADNATRVKTRRARLRRHVVLGKAIITVVAFAIFFLLYYMATQIISLL